MRKSAINLYSLLENLLEWSKMQRGVIEFSPERIVLADRIIYCVDMISGPAAKKAITLYYNIPDYIEVIADKHMLDAIIRNLVSNSIKFTNRNGIITVSASESDEGIVKISVHDTGIGMDAVMVKDLFKLDVDTRRKGTDDEPSTGLGLLLCKEFVEKHGGEIWVESAEGVSSTFTFSIDNNKLRESYISDE
jgi:signal transduction histidine kinase